MKKYLCLFGTLLHISRLALVDQQTCKPRLIFNSREEPDSITPAVKTSSDKSYATKAMKFGPCLEQLLHIVWEADSKEFPVWISKWYISDAFHRCKLRPEDVGKFSYVVPPVPSDTSSLLCIDLVLPVG